VLALSSASPRAGAQSPAGIDAADVGITHEILEYSVQGGTIENLVRLTASNHGPDSVSSFVVGTCLTEPWPVDVVDDFPGGCNSYGLVIPCAEFGLGFQFPELEPGESMQCLARISGPSPALPVGLQLSVGRLINGEGEFMIDPNPANGTIELNPVGAPPAPAAVPASSVASMLGLTCLLAWLVRRRMRRVFRVR
jgi:hypothetical protein